MRLTQASWKSGGRLLSLALLGGLTVSPAGAAPNSPSPAHTSPAHMWLSPSGGWLCRTWSTLDPGSSDVVLVAARNGPTTATMGQETAAFISAGTMTYCTREWRVAAPEYLISDMPDLSTRAWSDAQGLVPLRLMDMYAIRHQPTPKPAPKPRPASPPAYYQPPSAPPPMSPPPGGYNPWAPVPGHPGYAMSDFAGDPWSAYFGYCTWYAWYRHQNEPLLRLGNAAAWAWNAPKFGLRTGSVPVVGATVVFQPGVEGAGSGGHVAHVEAVLGGGWFIVSEMNFGLNGGGWGRVDWRYAYVTSGVTFIY